MATRRSGRRADYEWVLSTVAGAVSAGGSAAPAGVLTTSRTITVNRVRGELLASIDAPTDGDRCILAAGIIVASADALAAGATSLPHPIDDGNAPWLWHGFIPLLAQAANLEHTVAGRLMIDLKAMRRMKPNEVLAFTLAIDSLAGTPAIDFVTGMRILASS